MMRTRHKIITVAMLLILVGLAVSLVGYVRRPVILYETEYLPSLDGFPTAHSINDLGQVVMSRVILSPTAAIQTQIYIWDSRKAQVDYGPFTKGFVSDLRINNAGQICGMLGHPNAYQQPFFWDPNDGLTTFGKRNKTGNRITGMNSAGQVIGYDKMQKGHRGQQSFVWDSRTGLIDLGSLGGGGTVACSINDSGQITGVSISNGPTSRKQGFLWDGRGGMSGIDILTATHVHINNNGLVIGAPFRNNSRMIELVSWHEDTDYKTLTTFTGYLGNVQSVNDTGQVLLVIRRKGFQILKCRLFDRSEYWLWDPRRGKLQLAKQVHCAEGYFRPVDINNDGWILGSISDEQTNRPIRWLLLKPIEDMWKEYVDEH